MKFLMYFICAAYFFMLGTIYSTSGRAWTKCDRLEDTNFYEYLKNYEAPPVPAKSR